MRMFLYVVFATLMASSLSDDVIPPLCKVCNCEAHNNTYRVTCVKNTNSAIFDTSSWIDSNNKTYPYQSLTIENTPIVTLKDQFPPSNITYLKMSNTSMVNISDSVFQNLQDMVTLVLSFNNIEVIHPNAFDGLVVDNGFRPLRSLKNLYLDFNRIHSLDADIFQHTPNIEFLSLSHNPLNVLDHQTLVAITSLAFLTKLDLSHTELTALPDTMLHTPKFLSFLDLSGNGFTTIPQTLSESHNLTILYFNNNPIENLTSETGFPKIPTLKALHLNSMPKLVNISKGVFSNLENLEELYCFDNPKLSYIDTFALSSRKDGAEYETWPPIKKLYLQSNKLAFIDMQLVLSWKDLIELDLTDNPWTCECENQWIADELMPIYLKLDQQKAKALKCAAPIEMVAYTLYDIYKDERTMRCLDVYGHRPERDGTLLVGILAGVLITIPLVLFVIYAYQRHWFGLFDSSPAGFSRQFYKRTVSEDGYF